MPLYNQRLPCTVKLGKLLEDLFGQRQKLKKKQIGNKIKLGHRCTVRQKITTNDTSYDAEAVY